MTPPGPPRDVSKKVLDAYWKWRENYDSLTGRSRYSPENRAYYEGQLARLRSASDADPERIKGLERKIREIDVGIRQGKGTSPDWQKMAREERAEKGTSSVQTAPAVQTAPEIPKVKGTIDKPQTRKQGVPFSSLTPQQQAELLEQNKKDKEEANKLIEFMKTLQVTSSKPSDQHPLQRAWDEYRATKGREEREKRLETQLQNRPEGESEEAFWARVGYYNPKSKRKFLAESGMAEVDLWDEWVNRPAGTSESQFWETMSSRPKIQPVSQFKPGSGTPFLDEKLGQKYGMPTFTTAQPQLQPGGGTMFTGGTPFFDERTGQRIPKPRPDLIDWERSDPNLAWRRISFPRGSQPQPNLGLGGGTMFAGGTPFFDERTGQRVFNPTLPIPRKPSMLNGMSWDGRSRGPESLLFQQGLIPNRMTGQFAAPATSNMGFGKGLGRSFYSGVIA